MRHKAGGEQGRAGGAEGQQEVRERRTSDIERVFGAALNNNFRRFVAVEVPSNAPSLRSEQSNVSARPTSCREADLPARRVRIILVVVDSRVEFGHAFDQLLRNALFDWLDNRATLQRSDAW